MSIIDKFSLTGHIALVTGAGRGIALAFAEAGGLSILVNNAGGAGPNNPLKTSAALFLASPAASWISGKVIELDGGTESAW